jgi:hypothetical protein
MFERSATKWSRTVLSLQCFRASASIGQFTFYTFCFRTGSFLLASSKRSDRSILTVDISIRSELKIFLAVRCRKWTKCRVSRGGIRRTQAVCRSETVFFRSALTSAFHTGLFWKPAYGHDSVLACRVRIACRFWIRKSGQDNTISGPGSQIARFVAPTNPISLECCAPSVIDPSWGFNAVDVGTSSSSCFTRPPEEALTAENRGSTVVLCVNHDVTFSWFPPQLIEP